MAKRIKLVNPAEPIPDISCETDWKKCIFCQTDMKENLQCPAKYKNSNLGTNFETLECQLREFEKFRLMPMRLQLARLDDGTGIKNTLMKNNAVWHKLCRLQFNETKLSHAKSKNLFVTE